MKPLADLGRDEARGLTGIFFDLDDTLLTRGVLERGAYGALWDLHASGLRLVAVTGRPSGWAEIFVRQWPIDGAVAENGAVAVVRDGHAVRVLVEPGVEERRARLDALVQEVRRAMPLLMLAVIKAAVPQASFRRWISAVLVRIAENWVANNVAILNLLR